MTVQKLIEASLRKLGVIASGETPEVTILNDSLEMLQMMLRLWASKRILVYASTKESFSLVVGRASYTWGSGGNITTARPNSIIGAYVRDTDGNDSMIEIISEGQYRAKSDKSSTGTVESLFYHPLYPLGYLYLFPTSDTTDTMYVDSLKPFTETSSFDALTSTVAFPPNYEEALVYNLAVRLASDFGKTISQETALVASNSYDTLVTLNSGNQVEPISLSLPMGNATGSYDIAKG